MMRTVIHTAMACLLTVGCTQPTATQLPPVPVTDVINQLKQELAAFRIMNENAPMVPACGGGQPQPLRLSIANINLDLKTSLTTSVSGKFEATLPVAPVTLGPSIGAGLTTDNSQNVILNFKPSDLAGIAPASVADLHIANALITLRDQLANVNHGAPCLTLLSGDKGPTIKLAFTATREASAGGKIGFLILSLSATAQNKSVEASTLTVTLDAPKGTTFQPLGVPRARGSNAAPR